MLSRLLTILVLATSIWDSTALAEESMYVDDKLMIRVTKEPGGSSSVATIRSGDKLEIKGQKNGYTNIVTTKGLKGWVKSKYLVTEKPAIIKLKELAGAEKKMEVLLGENSKLKSENSKLTAEAKKNQQALSALKKESDQQKQHLEAISASTEANQNEDSLLKVLIEENETLKGKIFSIQQLLGHSDLVASQAAEKNSRGSVPIQADFEFKLPVTFEDWRNLFDYGWLRIKSVNLLLLGLFFLAILISFFYGRFLLAQRIRQQYSGVKIW